MTTNQPSRAPAADTAAIHDDPVRRRSISFAANLLAGYSDKPKDALQFVADALQAAGAAAGPADENDLHDQFIDLEQVNDGARKQAEIPWLAAIDKAIDNVGHRGTDVNRTAKDRKTEWLKRALRERYKITDDSVVRKFAGFVLGVVTEGFVGKDTTGTTIGNFAGSNNSGAFYEGK